MSDRKRSTAKRPKTRANTSNLSNVSIASNISLDTSSTTYTCDVCKGNDTLRSALQSDSVKTFISKISEITVANEKLSDQITLLKKLELNIQHLLINPKELVSNNKKLDKLDSQFKQFENHVTAKTDQLTQLVNKLSDSPPPLSPTILKKLDDFVSVTPHDPPKKESDRICKPQSVIKADYIVPEDPYKNLIENFVGDSDMKLLREFVNNDKYEQRQNCHRETSYYGEFSYKYGNTYHPARKVPAVFEKLGNSIKEKFPDVKNKILTFLTTKYINGEAYCPSHSDNEPSLSPTDDIFTFSLGADRTMKFNGIHNDDVVDVTLHENSLLVFSRSSQCHWKHAIPVDESVDECRYSVTVRINEPFNVNSSRLYGDSNTAFIKFGVGPKTLGRWCPGERIKASRVGDLPSPADVPPVRNMIIHTGINDLRDRYNPLSPAQIVKTMENKCAAIHRLHPQMRIIISPLLPTRNAQLNNLVRETNRYIEILSGKHYNIIMSDNSVFANEEGLLLDSLGSRKVNDIVHINLSGIIKLGLILRSYILPYRAKTKPNTGTKNAVNQRVSHSTTEREENSSQSATLDGGASSISDTQGEGTAFPIPGVSPRRS